MIFSIYLKQGDHFMKKTLFILVTMLSVNSFAFIKINHISQNSAMENKTSQTEFCEKACDCSKMNDKKIQLRFK